MVGVGVLVSTCYSQPQLAGSTVSVCLVSSGPGSVARSGPLYVIISIFQHLATPVFSAHHPTSKKSLRCSGAEHPSLPPPSLSSVGGRGEGEVGRDSSQAGPGRTRAATSKPYQPALTPSVPSRSHHTTTNQHWEPLGHTGTLKSLSVSQTGKSKLSKVTPAVKPAGCGLQ